MKSTIPLFFIVSFIILMSVPACELIDEPLTDDPRERFLGEWNCQEYFGGQPQTAYSVIITADPTDSTRIILDNFAFIGFNEKPPYGIVDDAFVTIPVQKVCFDQSITVWGDGQSVSKNELHWEYTVEVGGDSYEYTAVFLRSI